MPDIEWFIRDKAWFGKQRLKDGIQYGLLIGFFTGLLIGTIMFK